MDLIGLTEFEQYEDDKTDTVIYTFNKMVKLLLECNPNTCEILGLDGELYLIRTALGQELLDHTGIFLSKRAAKSFGGYAGAQLRRLQNAIARDSMSQTERESVLPDNPDMEKVEAFVEYVNRRAIEGDY